MRRTYRISWSSAADYISFGLLWFGAIFWSVVVGEFDEEWSALRVGGVRLGIAFALPPALVATLITYEVSLEDDVCEFRSVRGTKTVRVHQIRSMEADDDGLSIRYDGGKVSIWAVADFKDFLTRVVELNPAMEVKGWIRGPLEIDSTGLDRSQRSDDGTSHPDAFAIASLAASCGTEGPKAPK